MVVTEGGTRGLSKRLSTPAFSHTGPILSVFCRFAKRWTKRNLRISIFKVGFWRRNGTFQRDDSAKPGLIWTEDRKYQGVSRAGRPARLGCWTERRREEGETDE